METNIIFAKDRICAEMLNFDQHIDLNCRGAAPYAALNARQKALTFSKPHLHVISCTGRAEFLKRPAACCSRSLTRY